MRRLKKQQAFICILISLFVGANLCGLSFNIVELNQGKPFSFTSSKELPLHNSESYPAPLLPWQVDGSNAILAQSATEVSSNGVLTRSTGNAQIALRSYRYEIVPKHKEISFHHDSLLNTIFKLVNRQACQYLDIPPPYALASLQV